ncbi:formamidopyrimidine-DNA glycosylase [Legionella lansingensis]|uniref:Formamidopyrimidine-DNA glycosylase n=1 Tax=Legionella lansingensis TaxID=45067 RepID=A0A0W0VQE3_9GAMM|nr:bifunctional DNA-formamidopyrimidine glycosylase/DNA-(apurinic or apyrimidinic site) lyase [Legionella lansingensis]KTD22207.1 formamidopyrimidine-DNA glycosylase [Legionella lansingensis]SNV55001.1 formamidopyrimidine-DNA glycosylase [Legionella lansingensis]
MPELPEVETTRRGIAPFLVGKAIKNIVVRQLQLRLAVPPLNDLCSGQKVKAVIRRAKYLLLQLTSGHLLIHLGMSGHLRLIQTDDVVGAHDHIDLLLEDGYMLRYNDPRRFGLWQYFTGDPYQYPLLNHLGPEPLSEAFHADYLSQKAFRKRQNIKSFIMRSDIVAGVGNIYATESLFFAGIHPQTPAGSLQAKQVAKLVYQIKRVLEKAIIAGGTTLRDFFSVDGKPGYFSQDLKVYGRKNLPCFHCHHIIEVAIIAGRSSAFCPHCQPSLDLLHNR